jgi:hypothetical protein
MPGKTTESSIGIRGSFSMFLRSCDGIDTDAATVACKLEIEYSQQRL